MIENVYVTLKLKFKSCVLFIYQIFGGGYGKWYLQTARNFEEKGTLEQILESRG